MIIDMCASGGPEVHLEMRLNNNEHHGLYRVMKYVACVNLLFLGELQGIQVIYAMGRINPRIDITFVHIVLSLNHM